MNKLVSMYYNRNKRKLKYLSVNNSVKRKLRKH